MLRIRSRIRLVTATRILSDLSSSGSFFLRGTVQPGRVFFDFEGFFCPPRLAIPPRRATDNGCGVIRIAPCQTHEFRLLLITVQV